MRWALFFSIFLVLFSFSLISCFLFLFFYFLFSFFLLSFLFLPFLPSFSFPTLVEFFSRLNVLSNLLMHHFIASWFSFQDFIRSTMLARPGVESVQNNGVRWYLVPYLCHHANLLMSNLVTKEKCINSFCSFLQYSWTSGVRIQTSATSRTFRFKQIFFSQALFII